EAQIIHQLAEGRTNILDMVPVIYAGVAPGLFPAAARSTFAHLLHLLDQGKVAAEPAATIDARWRLV
ncbi:MAG: MBL fold metallo-hydrolase, partial [Zavarzinia sp.]|nr:MBL fold metallo-hydrolase [Zavarzinia sp.]